MGGVDEIISSEEEDQRTLVRPHVLAWDAFPVINSLPPRARTPQGNNEGVDIPLSPEVERATPVMSTHASLNRPTTRLSAATITIQVTAESERQNEAVHEEEVLHVDCPISTAHSTPVTAHADDDDDDLPLGALLNMNRNASSNQVATTDIARARRSIPTLPMNVELHQGPMQSVDDEVRGSIPQPTQPSSASGPGESILGAPDDKSKKRIRRIDEKTQRNPKRTNPVVQRFIIGASNSTLHLGESSGGTARHPRFNIDGINDTLRVVKHLVSIQAEGSRHTQVRNLNSEVEREVPQVPVPVPREDDENASYGDNEETDPDADEVSSDDTFIL